MNVSMNDVVASDVATPNSANVMAKPAVENWLLEVIVNGPQLVKSYRLKPVNASEWCYVSGLVYESNCFAAQPGENTNSAFVQLTAWINRIPFQIGIPNIGQTTTIPPDAFNTLYGEYPQTRTWLTLGITGQARVAGEAGFPNRISIYTISDEGNTELFLGFIDLTDPQ